MKLRCRDRYLPLDRTAIVGILNVTPDSFSDGGLWLEPHAAIAHGIEMVEDGAAVIDVGGESTRPGADPVDEDEECRRVIPVIEGLVEAVDVPVSIDTRKASVAQRAVEAGASIVNDTTGEESAGVLDETVVKTGAAVIVMHSRGIPKTMQGLTEYQHIVEDVADFLSRRVKELCGAGVPEEAIVCDPGIGFAKSAEQNLVLLRELDRIVSIGPPVLVGTSRKSFISLVLDVPAEQRLEGTAATVAWSVMKGARLMRVHDVAAMTRVARMTEAILQARPES
jgi:dihydropteroate synthase